MSEEIIKVLDELGKRLGIAIDWSNQNIMPYLQELAERFISFRNIQAVIWIIISLIIIGLGIFSLIKLIKWRKSDKYDTSYTSDDGSIFGLCLTGLIVLLLICSVIIICNIERMLQNIFLPELTVINYIKGYLV